MNHSRFLIAAAVLFLACAGVHAQQHETRQAKTSSIHLGSKVVVIPDPDDFEEASSQFKPVRDTFTATEVPQAEFLLSHLPAAECQSLRNGASLVLNRYTKISILKDLREQDISDEVMSVVISEFRKNSGAVLDPDGPTMKSVMENAQRGLSNVSSKPVDLTLNATENLGEFDQRPQVFSVMLLLTYKTNVAGTQTVTPVLASLTFLNVNKRLLYVSVYRKISSPAALKTELKPGIADVKQFTTKWVNQILAANKEGQ